MYKMYESYNYSGFKNSFIGDSKFNYLSGLKKVFFLLNIGLL